MKKILGFVISAILAALFAAPVLAANSASLSWVNATANTDGSAIPATGPGSLVSTLIDYGPCAGTNIFGTVTGTITVAAPATTVSVPLVTVQTYCFRASHLNTYNVQSGYSNIVSKALPPPTPNAPSTLSVAALLVYDIVKQKDKLVMLPVGTVPAGTACDPTQSVNGYYAVPSSAATWYGSVHPVVVFAQCS